MKNKVTLSSFIKQECCNYNVHYDICVGPYCDSPCNVKIGKPCKYFEKVIISIAAQQGCYDDVVNQYKEINLGFRKKAVARFCPDCGNVELAHRQRLCPSCAKKHRREAQKKQKTTMKPLHPVESGFQEI